MCPHLAQRVHSSIPNNQKGPVKLSEQFECRKDSKTGLRNSILLKLYAQGNKTGLFSVS